MATVVDSLTVTLGLDTSNFAKGQEQARKGLKDTSDAATRTAKSMQSDAAKITEGFATVRNEVLGLLGVFMGGKGIQQFVQDTTKSVADLGREAQNAGVSAQYMREFGAAVYRMGGDAAAAEHALVGMAKAMQQALTGPSDPMRNGAFAFLGIDPNMSPEQAMLKMMHMVELLRGTPRGRMQLNQAGERAGFSQDLMNSLIQIGTVANFNRELANSRELGVPTPEMIRHFTELQTSLRTLEQRINFLATDALDKIAPSLVTIANYLTRKLSEPQAPPPTPKSIMDGSYFRDNPASEGMTFGPGRGLLGRLWGIGATPRTPQIDEGTRIRAERVREGLMRRGMDDETATAFAANSIAESEAIPSRREMNGGPGRGLFQITSTDRMNNYRRLYGHDPDQGSLDEQLDFTKWELENTERGAAFRIAGAKGAAAKAAAVSRFYERPKDTEGEATKRAAIADDISRNRLPARIVPLQPNFAPQPSGGRINHSSLEIGTVNVHTQATDATGIARDINRAIADSVTAQANTGLQ